MEAADKGSKLVAVEADGDFGEIPFASAQV
jgi:hypothetical protein